MTAGAAEFPGRVALVTGGGRGIGAAVVQALGARGAFVFVNYHRDADAAEATLAALRQGGGDGACVQASLADPVAVEAMFARIRHEAGRLDLLVNNAGILRDRLVGMMSEEDWTEVIEVNLNGTFRCTRQALRLMLARQWGRIVNISSVAGLTGAAGQANYAASKAALMGFTRSLAYEVSQHGIRVNCLVPGLIETGMSAAMPRERRQALIAQSALRRAGTATEVAEAAMFLLSDAASFVQGTALLVDGGLTHP